MTRKTRIVMVAPRFFPAMGGVETHVYEVGRRLIHAGLDLRIVTTDLSGTLPAIDEVEGMRVHRVPAWPRSSDYYFAPGVIGAIAAEEADLVHCQACHTLVPPLAMATAARKAIPYVVTFHTGGHSSWMRNAVRSLQWTALRPLLSRAERLIAVSEFEVKYFGRLLRLPEERFVLIPNGGSLTRANAPATVIGQKGSGSTAPQGPLVLSIGRLERYKGHHRVVAAFRVVRQRIPDARLLIVGSGSEESRLREQIRQANLESSADITSILPSDRARMAQLVSSATLVALLSRYEGHPVAIMEALALGRPVLVANSPGLSEIADKGWATAVSLTATDEEIGHVMVERLLHPLYPRTLDLPTWDTCAAQLQELYQNVLSRRSLARGAVRAII